MELSLGRADPLEERASALRDSHAHSQRVSPARLSCATPVGSHVPGTARRVHARPATDRRASTSSLDMDAAGPRARCGDSYAPCTHMYRTNVLAPVAVLNKALVSINGRTHTRPFFRSWRHSAQHDACKVPTHERDRGDDVNTARELHPPPNKAALHLAQAIFSPSPHSPGEPSAQSTPKKLRWPGEGLDGRSPQDGAFQSPQPANFSLRCQLLFVVQS